MGARSCNCAGSSCGSGQSGVEAEVGGDLSRRDFLHLAGGAATAGMISLGRRPARAQQTAEAKEKALADWKHALHLPDAPRRYTSGVHTDVRFPLGGIGTGNIELGADGQFAVWQLFNTLRDGYVPFYFGVRTGSTARLLQTSGGPEGWTPIQKCEMTGEYPLAELTFTDPDLPVHISLTAWTLFAPMAEEFSSQPVACFQFRVSNPGKQKQTVHIGGFLQNAIGYDALGGAAFNTARFDNRHPNYGGNHNTLRRDGKRAVLSMQAHATPPAPLARPLQIYTNLPVDQLNKLPFERPQTMAVYSLEVLGTRTDPGDRIIWIDAAPLELSERLLQSLKNYVDAGATLIWSGVHAPLLDEYTAYQKRAASPDMPALLPDIIFEDFEYGYGRWKVEGTAFGNAPGTGTLPNQQPVSGFSGDHLVNSYVGGDDATGRLTSEPFTIHHTYIRFLIGGGSHPTTQVRLVVDGKVVRAQSGKNEERLSPVIWNVQDFKGKTGHIEIVDEQAGPWGHINADLFVFSDLPSSVALLPLVQQLLPVGNEETLPSHLGGHRFLRETRNNVGRVVRVLGDLMPPDSGELWGARSSAYAALCHLAGISYVLPSGTPSRAPGTGTLALATNAANATALPTFTDWQEAWRWFTESARDASTQVLPPSPRGATVNGALAASLEIEPGTTRELNFVLAWHYPNYYNAKEEFIGNHYATRAPHARAAAETALRHFSDLHQRTERFRETFYASTLPYWLRDCVSSQISTLRHAGIVFRSAAGDLYGWEGSNGCCPPTCTHVWGYEQSVAYLFPYLERNMRNIDLFHQQNPDGGINNRTEVPVQTKPSGEHPFMDGHASTILKAYREIRNSPDDALLHAYWPRVRAATEYLLARDAATSPNKEPDGTLRDDQWNTYDNAIHGVNSFIGSYYLAALRASEEMARRVKADGDADRYRSVFLSGQKQLIELCWNGEYFQQHLPGYENRAGEYGPGCLADQLIGQWWAHQLDLGYLLPPEMVKTALRSLFRYNWLPDHTNFRHNWRKFAGGTDKGLLLCTFPKGGRPAQTIPYVDEVWTGVEYQVAAHMLYEGMTDEAFAIIKGVRDRYDGIPRAPMQRNPWSEIECGGHYARAMSSWSLLLALSGWLCDGPNNTVRFAPRYSPERFESFFSGPEGWGIAKQNRTSDAKSQTNEIRVVEGKVTLAHLHLETLQNPTDVSVRYDGHALKANWDRLPNNSTRIRFDKKVTLAAGKLLQVELL